MHGDNGTVFICNYRVCLCRQSRLNVSSYDIRCRGNALPVPVCLLHRVELIGILGELIQISTCVEYTFRSVNESAARHMLACHILRTFVIEKRFITGTIVNEYRRVACFDIERVEGARSPPGALRLPPAPSRPRESADVYGCLPV